MKVHPDTKRLRTAIQACLAEAAPWSGTIYRFATVEYAKRADLLTGRGARKHGGRWNPPGLFTCVYGSLEPDTALKESLAAFRAAGIPRSKIPPQVLVAVAMKLQSVLDLSDATQLAKLKVTTSQLAAIDWEAEQNAGREAMTQAIGRLAWEEKLEAILIPSVRIRGAINLAVFPGRRMTGSSWRIQGARKLPKS